MLAGLLPGLGWLQRGPAPALEQPTAIYHAFQRRFADLSTQELCALAARGYSHLQISPAQKSNPGPQWWKRYQPVDSTVIEGLGSATDLGSLTARAHRCGLRVIADVVFNHMADLDGGEAHENLRKFPGLSPADFHTLSFAPGRRPCRDTDPLPDPGPGGAPGSGYADGNRRAELECWLGGLPDLRFTAAVRARQRRHLQHLLDLGVDGFRFDAAKHMPPQEVRALIAFVNARSSGRTWNYLEVIEDGDTRADAYDAIAAVTDFILYGSLRSTFVYGGDLRSLPPAALADPRSVTFGRNHDTIGEIREDPAGALNPFPDFDDAALATTYVLARQGGTPLVFGDDDRRSALIRTAVRFRSLLRRRAAEGRPVNENLLRVIEDPNLALMERGAEGFYLVNKAAEPFDRPVLDLTLSRLEGCYRELRSDLTVAIERRGDRKVVSRWGSWRRGGVRVEPRTALFFLRDSFERCRDR